MVVEEKIIIENYFLLLPSYQLQVSSVCVKQFNIVLKLSRAWVWLGLWIQGMGVSGGLRYYVRFGWLLLFMVSGVFNIFIACCLGG